MPLDFRRPVRLQIDFDPPPGVPVDGPAWYRDPDAGRWAVCLAEGLFFLQLGYPPPAGPGLEIFREMTLRAAGAGVTATAVTSPDGLPVGGLAGTGIREVAMDITGIPAGPSRERLLRSFAAEAAGLPERPGAGALARVGRGKLEAIPGILADAAAAGLGFVELPPPPLVYLKPDEAAAEVPGARDYRALEAALAASPPRHGLPEWRAHDILVSALLGRPGGRVAFGGCQAAGALAFVSSGGTVFPCAALPIPLGSVGEACAGHVWEGPVATEVRSRVSARMTACAGCPAGDRCLGACPAVRLASGGTWNAGDPLCDLYGELLGRPPGGGRP